MLTYLIVLFLPVVFLNGAYWGQCDSIYSTFCLFSIYLLLRKRYFLSFIILGVAFAFKLQTIFLIPAYLILYFSSRNFSFLNFLIIPAVNFIMCLPAIIMGRNIIDTLSIYFKQTSTWEFLTLGVPNLYKFIIGPYDIFSTVGILLTLVAFGFLLYFIIKKEVLWDYEKVIVLVLISILICNFLLPAMHERYLYIADIICVIWYVCFKKKIYIPILLNGISTLTYMNYLYAKIDDLIMFIMAIIYVYILFDLIKYFNTLCIKKKGDAK